MARAAWRASARAVTTRSAPRTQSPAAKTPGREVAPVEDVAMVPRSVVVMPLEAVRD